MCSVVSFTAEPRVLCQLLTPSLVTYTVTRSVQGVCQKRLFQLWCNLLYIRVLIKPTLMLVLPSVVVCPVTVRGERASFSVCVCVKVRISAS